MRAIVTIGLLIAAAIHLVPVVGLAGASKLSALYGIDANGPTLSILMRHRAVLFGLLGGFLAVAAFVPGYQPPALVMGAVSALAFVVIAWTTRGANTTITTIVRGDLVALAALAFAAFARVRLP